MVATVLTVYGIETFRYGIRSKFLYEVATVLTVYGIETWMLKLVVNPFTVATVLTVYGIETFEPTP